MEDLGREQSTVMETQVQFLNVGCKGSVGHPEHRSSRSNCVCRSGVQEREEPDYTWILLIIYRDPWEEKITQIAAVMSTLGPD